MGRLYGRAGRLNAKNGGLRPPPGSVAVPLRGARALAHPGAFASSADRRRKAVASSALSDPLPPGEVQARESVRDGREPGSNSGDPGGSLEPPGPLREPPGPLLTHIRTVCMAYSECLPTRLNPPAERACFSQVGTCRSPAQMAACPRPPGAVKRP
jgi:hypothetical protein